MLQVTLQNHDSPKTINTGYFSKDKTVWDKPRIRIYNWYLRSDTIPTS